jgi:hypothetical protein
VKRTTKNITRPVQDDAFQAKNLVSYRSNFSTDSNAPMPICSALADIRRIF